MDFLINYYVAFLIKNHLSMTTGFIIWHSVTFILMLCLLILAVIAFGKIERLFFKKFAVASFDNKDNVYFVSNEKSNILITVISLASIIFMWQMLPVSTSFYPLKNDIGVLFYPVFLLIPVICMLIGINLSDDKNYTKRIIKKVIYYCSSFIPLILSIASVVLLSGNLSLRNVVVAQSNLGIFGMFCIPAVISVFVIIYIMAVLYADLSKQTVSEKKRLLYNFMQRAYFFTLCAYIVVLFFGGYKSILPFFIANMFEHSAILYGLILSLEQAFWLIFKTYLLMFVIISVWRFNVFGTAKDVNVEVFWKYLLPLAVINILSVSIIAVKYGDLYVL